VEIVKKNTQDQAKTLVLRF